MKNYTDFLTLLSPSDSVKDTVKRHKLYAADVIGKYESMHSIAHISIKEMHRQKSFVTEPAIKLFNAKLATVPPVTLTINGFDYFNHGEEYRTIYAKINTPNEITTWFKTLKKHLNHKDFLVPHITIARNITVDDFNKLWPHFKELTWHESFTVNELTVLQKETFAPFAKWEPYTTIPFKAKQAEVPIPQPSLTKPKRSVPGQGVQTSLF